MSEPVEGIDYGAFTESDAAMLKKATVGGVEGTDFSHLYIDDEETSCHCGEPFGYGYDGDPTHHRGMCAHCDSVRCDAYPGACRPLRLSAAVDGFHP